MSANETQTSQNYTYQALITFLTVLGYTKDAAINMAFIADDGGAAIMYDANETRYKITREIGSVDYIMTYAPIPTNHNHDDS